MAVETTWGIRSPQSSRAISRAGSGGLTLSVVTDSIVFVLLRGNCCTTISAISLIVKTILNLQWICSSYFVEWACPGYPTGKRTNLRSCRHLQTVGKGGPCLNQAFHRNYQMKPWRWQIEGPPMPYRQSPWIVVIVIFVLTNPLFVIVACSLVRCATVLKESNLTYMIMRRIEDKSMPGLSSVAVIWAISWTICSSLS